MSASVEHVSHFFFYRTPRRSKKKNKKTVLPGSTRQAPVAKLSKMLDSLVFLRLCVMDIVALAAVTALSELVCHSSSSPDPVWGPGPLLKGSHDIAKPQNKLPKKK